MVHMHPPESANRRPGGSAYAREDPHPSEVDQIPLGTPDEVPGSIWQAVGSESLSTSMTDYSREETAEPSRRPDRSIYGAPIALRASMSMPEGIYRDRPGIDSPSSQSSFAPNPPFASLRHTNSADNTSSPRTDRLPSFRQLSKIADGGTETEARATSYPALPAQAIGPQGPAKVLPYFSGHQQGSPTATYAMPHNASPSGGRPDSHEMYAYAASPSRYPMPEQGHFAQRRGSFTSKAPPPFTQTLTSSSNETNLSVQSSGAESYATTSTTPTDVPESSSHGNMPLPQGPQPSPSQSGIFICEYPGCTASPFQTQYLLNSHANVHSSNRPHFCPVRGCSRGEGGKGFKRKNEMIRHGLVHESPGYICPFCPLREHKYPRPDNLQRHVRVHHVDKDKDDPLLREVLAQRPEGGSRGRRRRT